MPIALIELQKRIESLPGVHARQKDQATSIAQTEKMIVTRPKSESPRKVPSPMKGRATNGLGNQRFDPGCSIVNLSRKGK